MDNQITSSVPQVVVTEPSPISVQTESAESLVRKIEPIAEVPANGAPSEPAKKPFEQAASTPESSANLSNEEFVTAQACNECIVPVPEESSAQLESASTSTRESDQDNFRTIDMGSSTNCGIRCIQFYEKAWNMVHSRYAIPFWLLLLAMPITAGFLGAIYMYSCPASHSLPMLKFTIGVSLIFVISFRICVIIRRMSTTEEDEWGNMLHTLLLISTFLTIVFFITESMAFWKMESTTHSGSLKYCDPHFVTYSFWWNCVMFVAIVPIFLFPA